MPPYYPQDFANAYDVNSLWNYGTSCCTGTEQSIGITLWGPPPGAPALAQFAKETGAQPVNLKVIPIDTGPYISSDSQRDKEAGMDVEYTSAMAPGATIAYYEAPTTAAGDYTDTGLEDALNRAGMDNNQQISNSWGACEASDDFTTIVEMILLDNSATGHNYLFSSGDNGSSCDGHNPFPEYPATSAYATSVGGTTFQGNINPSWPGENAWSGSGGGYSNLFSEPAWQIDAGISDQSKMRGYPDVATDADINTGAYVCYNSNTGPACSIPGDLSTYAGGTSLATPLWAGMLADINQYLQAQNKPSAGFINPKLYLIATHKQPYAPYHDITSGTNGYYNASTGWDAVTGWGSPDLYNLAQDFAALSGTLDWSYQTSAFVESMPAVVNGVVYFGSTDYYVYALNERTGALIWRYLTGFQVHSSPAVVNGVVYIGSDDHYVYALDASDGTLLWNYQTGYFVDSTPAVVNGVVYVSSYDGYVYALNASTGAFIWRYGTESGASSPTVVNGVLYIGSGYGYVDALNTSDGSLLWQYQMGNSIASSPVVFNGVVYIGSEDYYVYALWANSGTLLWRYSTGGYSIRSSPVVANGILYIGDDGGHLYALNASSGTLIWSYQSQVDILTTPDVVNGVLYAGLEDVYALDANKGTFLWRYGTQQRFSSPNVANGVIYIGSGDGYVYALFT